MEPYSHDTSEVSILYVEDDPITRDLICTMIPVKFPGLNLLAAENGHSGLALYKEHRPDIVLTDISMPVMDGIRLASEIRMLNPEASIIVITAHSDTRYLLNAIDIGINRYVLKPIDQEKLFEAIEDCVARITLERHVRKQSEYICKLTRAVEQSPCMVIITDAKGVVEYVNPKFTEITGYLPEEVIGKTPRIPKLNARESDTYEKLWSTITAGYEWQGEFQSRKKSGELYWESASISPLFDAEGVITNYVAVKEDISERKRADNALKESEERYRHLYEDTPVMLHSIDGVGRIVNVSNYWLFHLGYERNEVIGRKSTEFLTEESSRYAEEIVIPAFFRSGHCQDIPYQMVKKNGEIVDVLLTAVAEWNATGEVIRSQAVMVDVTEQKKAEDQIRILNADLEKRVLERTAELENSNKELEAFCYAISHELRAPIARLEGFREVIFECFKSGDYGDLQYYVGRLGCSVQQLKSAVDALLMMNRLSKTEITSEPINLSELSRQVMAELIEVHGERTMQFRVAPDVFARGDRKLLNICMHNLLGNAYKYTLKTPLALIEFGAENHADQKVYYVRDNGAGFDMAYVSKLFQPFSRLHSEKEFKGTGIGLATVHRIIEKHEGKIWAESKVDEGATIFFTLGQ